MPYEHVRLQTRLGLYPVPKHLYIARPAITYPYKMPRVARRGGSMFLLAEEIVELTGHKRRDCQIRWLSNNGYPFEVSGAGRPLVLRAYLEQRLMGGKTAARRRVKPKLELLDTR